MGNEINRELSLSEIFSKSLRVAVENYLKVFPVFLACGVAAGILSTLITSASRVPSLSTNVTGLSSTELVAELNQALTYLGYQVLDYFAIFFILYFAVGVGIWIMESRIERQNSGDNLQLRQSSTYVSSANTEMQRSHLNYVSVALTALISVIFVLAGSILIFVGSLIIATILFLAPVAASIEGKSPFSALGRSRQLVSGRWFKTFAVMIGTFLLIDIGALAFADVLSLLFTGTTADMVANFVWVLVLSLEFPWISSAMLVLYHSNQVGQTIRFSPPKPPPSPYDDMKPEPMGYFGKKLTPRQFCPSCGAHVTADENYCHNCGTRLQQQETPG